MEEIAALNASTGQAILSILPPTLKIFIPHLIKNTPTIKSISSSTHSYGSHPRQKLDIYTPQTVDPLAPILVFFYGGGLIRGDKIIPQIPGGVVYANLGAFFALKGITTVIPDYRRVNSETGGEDAVFPSGGEDVSLVLKWLEGYVKDGKKDVYLMGNSAGGVHISTFLFGERFFQQRKSYVDGEKEVVLKGAIPVAVPCHFKTAAADRTDVLKAYYGDGEEVEKHCVHGLLGTLAKSGKSLKELGIPKTLALLGEYDPADEIGDAMKETVALWEKTWGEGIEFREIKGHNHISPPLALLSGDKEGDKWGEDVMKWIRG